jgi:hypothetical protein
MSSHVWQFKLMLSKQILVVLLPSVEILSNFGYNSWMKIVTW